MRRTKVTGVLATAGLAVGLLAAPGANAEIPEPVFTKEVCKEAPREVIRALFGNQGQCVKAANQARKGGDEGPPV